MTNLYTPVASSTFVNTNTAVVYTVRLATHNVPCVTLLWGKVGVGKLFVRKFYAESRDAARQYAESKIAIRVQQGFVQVA